jgi:hypothetical protein
MRTEPEPNQTTIKYRSTPEYKDGNRENQRARETAVPFRLMWPDTRDFRKLTPTFRNSDLSGHGQIPVAKHFRKLPEPPPLDLTSIHH